MNKHERSKHPLYCIRFSGDIALVYESEKYMQN